MVPPWCRLAPIDLVPGSILDLQVRNLSLPVSVWDPKVRNLSKLWANLRQLGTNFSGSWHELVAKAAEIGTKLK